MKFMSLAPMLQTNDMKRTREWYESVLGFTAADFSDDAWCSLSRDEVSIMFMRDDQMGPPSATAIQYFYVDDAMALAYLLASPDAEIVGIASTAGNVPVDAVQLSRSGEQKKGGELNFLMGFIMAALVIIPSLIYGLEIMRGIIAEKTDRVVEVLISSMSPRQ